VSRRGNIALANYQPKVERKQCLDLEEEREVLDPALVRDKEVAEVRVSVVEANKAARQPQAQMGRAYVPSAGILMPMSAPCHACKLCAPSAAQSCGEDRNGGIMSQGTVPEKEAASSPLHWRGLTSLTVTAAFLVLATTGVMLYVSPQGRVANWSGWSVLGLGKEQWAAAHTTAALLFIVASAFHVYFNWKALIHYLLIRRQLHLKREMAIAVAVVAVVFTGTVIDMPPFSTVVDLNTRIKAYWENRSEQAPYPHAELSTLAEFSQRTGIPLPVLQERLSESGITAGDPNVQTLEELARANNLRPNELFSKISNRRDSGGHGGCIGHPASTGV
jgi:hypothetical protein